MDWRKSVWSALKTAFFVLLSPLVASLLSLGNSAEWQAALEGIANALASAIPVVGGLFSGVLKGLLFAGSAALIAGLNNWWKHRNDPAPSRH